MSGSLDRKAVTIEKVLSRKLTAVHFVFGVIQREHNLATQESEVQTMYELQFK